MVQVLQNTQHMRSSYKHIPLLALLLSVGCMADSSELLEKPSGEKADSTISSRLCESLGAPSDCDVCEEAGWYSDGVCDTFCETPDDDCPVSTDLFVLEIDWRIRNSFGSLRTCSSAGADTVAIKVRAPSGDVVFDESVLCPLDPKAIELPISDYVIDGTLQRADGSAIDTYGPISVQEIGILNTTQMSSSGLPLQTRTLTFDDSSIFL